MLFMRIFAITTAMTMINNIREYTLNSTPGIWKSKVALVADDMYRGCSLNEGETSHTQSSDEIYDSLKSILPILPFYGIHYNIKHTGSGCAYPDLTENLIHTINNGVGLVNYIGHGDPETWSGENILSKSSDIEVAMTLLGFLDSELYVSFLAIATSISISL